MDRLFLDANILFSAAYRPDAGLLRLWRLQDVELVTSSYALEEAQVNLDTREQRVRLAELVRKVKLIGRFTVQRPSESVVLPAKDRPIL